MKLSQEEKDFLISLKQHPWYKVIHKIEEDAKNELWKKLLEADLSNQEDIKIIQKNQIYQQARDDFFKNIDKHTREIYTPKEV